MVGSHSRDSKEKGLSMWGMLDRELSRVLGAQTWVVSAGWSEGDVLSAAQGKISAVWPGEAMYGLTQS